MNVLKSHVYSFTSFSLVAAYEEQQKLQKENESTKRKAENGYDRWLMKRSIHHINTNIFRRFTHTFLTRCQKDTRKQRLVVKHECLVFLDISVKGRCIFYILKIYKLVRTTVKPSNLAVTAVLFVSYKLDHTNLNFTSPALRNLMLRGSVWTTALVLQQT